MTTVSLMINFTFQLQYECEFLKNKCNQWGPWTCTMHFVCVPGSGNVDQRQASDLWSSLFPTGSERPLQPWVQEKEGIEIEWMDGAIARFAHDRWKLPSLTSCRVWQWAQHKSLRSSIKSKYGHSFTQKSLFYVFTKQQNPQKWVILTTVSYKFHFVHVGPSNLYWGVQKRSILFIWYSLTTCGDVLLQEHNSLKTSLL